MRSRRKSPLVFILLALIPYSRQNLLLSFSPNRFFNELEKQSGYSKDTLKITYKRAQRRGLIGKDIPQLTKIGDNYVHPFIARKLERQACLMVIFDIPESSAAIRQRLRDLLKELEFKQIQKSVWSTEFDHRETLVEAIAELKAGKYVQIYEAAKLFPST